MRMFITSKNKYLSNDMKIFGTCSIPLNMIVNLADKLEGAQMPGHHSINLILLWYIDYDTDWRL